MSIPRRPLIAAGVVLLLVVAGVVAWLVTRSDDDDAGRLATAVAMAPNDAARLGWTDWSGVREELDADVSASSPAKDVERFLSDGFDADLTSTSALVASAPVLQEKYGFSPATVDWELFSQSTEGAIVIIGLPDSADLDHLEDTIAGIGYQKPSLADGVWIGGPDLLIELGTVTQEFAFLTVDRDRRLVAASDEAATLESWRDEQRGLDDNDDIGVVTDAVEGAVSASIYSGDYACAALAMTQADDPDRTRAADLIAEAGDINPYGAFSIASLPGGDVRVAMAFDTDEQARTNADTRSKLAAGPAPGQGGAFPDRFELGDVTADGKVVTMELDPLPGTYVMSDFATGPVLFATC